MRAGEAALQLHQMLAELGLKCLPGALLQALQHTVHVAGALLDDALDSANKAVGSHTVLDHITWPRCTWYTGFSGTIGVGIGVGVRSS